MIMVNGGTSWTLTFKVLTDFFLWRTKVDHYNGSLFPHQSEGCVRALIELANSEND